MLISDADAISFACLNSRAHFLWFPSSVVPRVLISAANADSFNLAYLLVLRSSPDEQSSARFARSAT